MRILYHHRTLGDGAEGIHISEMVKAFRKLGHEVVVAGPVGELKQTLVEQKGFISSVKALLPGALFELLEFAYSGFCFIDISIKAKRWKPHLIYDRYITFNAGTVWASRFCKIPLALEVNAPLALERSQEKDEKLCLKQLAHAVERYVCSNANTTIVVSTPLKRYLETVGIPEGKCVVMPNGVDTAKFHPQTKNAEIANKLEIPKNAVVIGFTGILRPWHGIEVLIKAVQRLYEAGTSVFLLVVGDGPIRDTLQKEINSVGLTKNSHITGRVPHEKVADYISLFDIAVSPRATFYASPMKIVEYMAQGKAVVAPKMPNIEDMICDGESGILFEEGNVNALAEKLLILSRNAALREKVGKGALAAVQTRLNWTANARWVAEHCPAAL
jgi:glycosyltransferase involved in cell wall biosynthesis